VDPQVIRDFTQFAEQLEKDKAWGSIIVEFREGIPMTISSQVNRRIIGAQQASIAKGEKPNVKAYR
jgi:hypothetical protein